MHQPAVRRAGASLIALLTTPSSRTAEHRVCHRATLPSQHHRAISSTTRRWQQQQAASPTPNTRPPSSSVQPSSQQTTQSQQPTTLPQRSLTEGLSDPPPTLSEDEKQVDWTRSYHGLSSSPFTAEQAAILQQELSYDDIEIKPDGIIYLPEIKYRRILNKAFGPGGWGLAPRGETIVTGKVVTREYGLVAGGR